MSKKLLIALTVVLVIAFAIPAFAAITDVQKKEISETQKQITALRKQLVQKYVDAGQITKEQGTTIQKNIDQRQEYIEQNPTAMVPGAGGCGNCPQAQAGGEGRGFGRMGGQFGGGCSTVTGAGTTGSTQGI